MSKKKTKQTERKRRHLRVRAKIRGTKECPRLSVFRSLRHIYAQIIDDDQGKVLVSADDREIKTKKQRNKKTKKQKNKEIEEQENKETERILLGRVSLAYQVGKLIAEKALKKKINKIIFDRGGYKYHGRVKALSEGAREGGLKF